jgi:hypothetical protein
LSHMPYSFTDDSSRRVESSHYCNCIFFFPPPFPLFRSPPPPFPSFSLPCPPFSLLPSLFFSRCVHCCIKKSLLGRSYRSACSSYERRHPCASSALRGGDAAEQVHCCAPAPAVPSS